MAPSTSTLTALEKTTQDFDRYYSIEASSYNRTLCTHQVWRTVVDDKTFWPLLISVIVFGVVNRFVIRDPNALVK